jgi:hypothetical protein
MNENMVRDHLREMMEGGAAHIGFEKAVDGFPVNLAGETVRGLEHTMWMLVEHLRLVNRDLIDWVTSEDYSAKPYPKGYWPTETGPADAEAWSATVEAVRRDMELMRSWITDEERDITAPWSGTPLIRPCGKYFWPSPTTDTISDRWWTSGPCWAFR